MSLELQRILLGMEKPISIERSPQDVLIQGILSLSRAGLPIQPFTAGGAADRGLGNLERGETYLEGESVVCFTVGGEKRLCFPQIANTVLRSFSSAEINRVCAELNINRSHCSPAQLEVLRASGALPPATYSADLVTKSDAERLCYRLLSRPCPEKRPRTETEEKAEKVNFNRWIPVEHDCFGGCTGRLHLAGYVSPSAECVECEECGQLLSPDRFVCHSHSEGETKTCHWGFDSARWRCYIHPDRRYVDDPKICKELSQLKTRFEVSNNKRPSEEDEEALQKRFRPMTGGLCEPLTLLQYTQPVHALQSLHGFPSAVHAAFQPIHAAFSAGQAIQSLQSLQGLHSLQNLQSILAQQQQQQQQSMQQSVEKALDVGTQEAAPQIEKPRRCEPLKKHLLHQFRKEKDELAESAANEAKEDLNEASLDRLLKRYVPDGAGLKAIRERIAESQRSLETQLDAMAAQNRILLHEIAYLRNKQQTSR